MTDARLDQSTSPSAGIELPGRAILQNIWRRKWIVVAVTALCLAIAGVRLIFAERIYRATAQFFIEEASPAFETKGRNSPVNLLTQAELLKSTPVLVEALSMAGVRTSDTLADVENPIGVLKENIGTDVDKFSDIVTVSYQGPVRDDTELILNAVLDSYRAFIQSRQKDSGAAMRDRLLREQAERQLELTEKKHEMFRFRSVQGIGGSGDGDSLILKQLSGLSGALTDAQLDQLNAKAQYEEAASIISADLTEVKKKLDEARDSGGLVTPGGDLQPLQEELTALQQRLRALRAQYLPEHPLIRGTRNRLDLLTLSYVAALEFKWQSTTRRVDQLQETIKEVQQRALEMDEKAALYAELESEVSRIQSIFEATDNRIKEMNVNDDVPVFSANVFEGPEAGVAPVSPNKKTALFQAMMLGLILGCGATFLDRRLRSSEEVRDAMGLPVLGVVPHMSGVPSPNMRMRRVLSDAGSEESEAYRAIRTAMFFALRHDESRTILICSPEAGDGKSTLTANLAIALAQAGQKVLLIDGDFRRPALHRAFDLSDTAGLSNVLSGDDTAEQAIQATSVAGLDVLPAGAAPANSAELLNSGSFTDLIETISTKYDYVLVDSPPTIAVSDARILSALCDVTLVVIRADHTTRRAATRTRDALRSVGGNLAGVVINDAPRNTARYDLSSYDDYRYEPTRTPRAKEPGTLSLSVKPGKTA